MTWLGVKASFRYIQSNNTGHVEGASENSIAWRIGVWFDGDLNIKY